MRIPALLSVNPELQRNLWLELSLTRLVAMPVALVVILGGVQAVAGAQDAAGATRFVLAGLLLFWGSRLAADGFGEEVASRTWDNQRLSAASAWSMAVGKLVGGTSYVWYGALLCVPALIAFSPEEALRVLEAYLIAGLIAQGSALLAVLVLHRFDPASRRAHTTIAQLIGFAFGMATAGTLPGAAHSLAPSGAEVVWYGVTFPAESFVMSQELVAILWLVVGIVRAIRREFGHADGPLGWTILTLYGVQLAVGLVLGRAATGVRVAESLAVAALVSAALTYAGLVVTPAAPAGLRRLAASVSAGRWLAAWRNLPIWVPSAVAAALCVAALVLDLVASAEAGPGPLLPLAALGFLVRDIGIVYLVRLTWKRRTLIALAILFGLLYGLLPAMFDRPELAIVHAIFLPVPPLWTVERPTALGIGAALPWLEAAAVLAAAWQRLRLATKP